MCAKQCKEPHTTPVLCHCKKMHPKTHRIHKHSVRSSSQQIHAKWSVVWLRAFQSSVCTCKRVYVLSSTPWFLMNENHVHKNYRKSIYIATYILYTGERLDYNTGENKNGWRLLGLVFLRSVSAHMKETESLILLVVCWIISKCIRHTHTHRT